MSTLQNELADMTLYGLVALALIIAWFEVGRWYRRTMRRNELDGEIEELKSSLDGLDEQTHAG